MAINAAPESRAAPPDVAWRTFLRGLAVELGPQIGADATAVLLRRVGLQMAAASTLADVGSLEALELEMNLVLTEIGWGSVQVALQEAERCVVLIHIGMPRISSAGEPPGSWLAPVLEGLYQGWMGQQPGADGSLLASIARHEGDKIVLRYGR